MNTTNTNTVSRSGLGMRRRRGGMWGLEACLVGFWALADAPVGDRNYQRFGTVGSVNPVTGPRRLSHCQRRQNSLTWWRRGRRSGRRSDPPRP